MDIGNLLAKTPVRAVCELLGDLGEWLGSSLGAGHQDGALGRAYQQRRPLLSVGSRRPDLLEEVREGIAGSREGCRASIEHVGVVGTGDDPRDSAASLKAGGFE